ncbi:hypothetical protein AB1Y20_011533 [Prymnesium parvum]|uniref:Uncharacterized protein n=1 Tax=Prymnesium parvum TaxID=97485 RepID=A0AB34IIV7_PRYPA
MSVPGSYWGTAARRGEAVQQYICIINDFTLLHSFSATQKGPAFQLMECGVTGSEGNSEPFWMPYPYPFLEFWYKENPIKPLPLNLPAAQTTAGEGHVNGEEDTETKQNRTEVYQYLDRVRSFKVTSGKQKGRMCHSYKCNILCANGVKCGGSVTIYGKSTSPYFKHVRRKAKMCNAHFEVSRLLDVSSCRQVQLPDGSFVTVFNFEECFPHHVRFTWLVAAGMAMRMNRSPALLEYVRGFEPRAVLPHNETIHRIAFDREDVYKGLRFYNGEKALTVKRWLNRTSADASGLTFEEWDPISEDDLDPNVQPAFMVVNSSENVRGVSTHLPWVAGRRQSSRKSCQKPCKEYLL